MDRPDLMQLTDRFFEFTDQQLADLTAKEGIQHLGLYVSAPPNQQGPPLLLIRQWSANERSLPAADADPYLRLPHQSRRWYPLQDAGLILGALRADLDPQRSWNLSLDQRMRRSAAAISHALGRDLECLQLRQELSQQNDQLRTLVHQLRNPLAALRTYAQLLMRRLEADSSHRPLVEGMLSEQRQLGQYIDVLDDLGQQRLPQQETLGPTLLPPGPAAGEATMRSLLMPLLERAEATASLQGRPWEGPQAWPQWIDQPSQDGTIAEIVANLLENAFRYSPAGCSVGLCLLPDGLCVWDDGPPIPIEEREMIFERGARGSTGQDRAGTGLGLALARSLAERQGRNLSLCVEPTTIAPDLPAEGNAFILNWPAETTPGRAA